MYKPRKSRTRETCVQLTTTPTPRRGAGGHPTRSPRQLLTLFLTLLTLLLLRAEPTRGEAALADSLQISSRFSSSEVKPNDEFTLTLSLDDPGDLYYFSFMIDVDFDVMEFVKVESIGITEGGAAIDGIFGGQYIAAAVSRTDNTLISQTGDFLRITFRVKSLAQGESIDFSFLSPELSDSNGDDLPFVLGAPPPLTLAPGVGVSELTLDATNQITEGESFEAHGRIYASGISPDTLQWDQLEVQIGLQEGGGTPDTWDETSWKDATLLTNEVVTEPEGIGEEPDAELYAYARASVTHRLEPGTYQLAIRSRVTGEEKWTYGGMETLPESGSGTLPTLEVSPQPVFRYALGEWTFERDAWNPDRATVANDSARFYGTNRKPLPESPDRSETDGSQWLQVDGWDPDPVGEIDGVPQKAIQTILSTEGFTNLSLSGRHTGTSAGPASFIVELSLDGESWEALDGGEIDLTAESTVTLENLPLPVTYEEQPAVWIRWRQASGDRIDGTDSPISASSYFRMTDIVLSGENPNPSRIDIHPGDANGDQTVDAIDVLALAHYWQVHGPAPAYDYIDFEKRTVEAWIPEPATHADTNGDGQVDHRDLKAIGLHFGMDVPEEGGEGTSPSSLMDAQLVDQSGSHNETEPDEPIARLTLPAMEMGDERLVYLSMSEPVEFKGVAVSLRLQSTSTSAGPTSQSGSIIQQATPDSAEKTLQTTSNSQHPVPAWTLELDQLPETAETWREENRLLEFQVSDPTDASRQAVAWSLQGRHEHLRDPEITVLRITATESWDEPQTLTLESLTLSGKGGELTEPDAVEMTLSQSEPPGMGFPEEEELTLYPNYPNPANGSTTIRYYLPERVRVHLELFDIAGRKVRTAIHTEQEAGLHTHLFETNGLASGVYLYRLTGGSEVRIGKMVLIR